MSSKRGGRRLGMKTLASTAKDFLTSALQRGNLLPRGVSGDEKTTIWLEPYHMGTCHHGSREWKIRALVDAPTLSDASSKEVVWSILEIAYTNLNVLDRAADATEEDSSDIALLSAAAVEEYAATVSDLCAPLLGRSGGSVKIYNRDNAHLLTWEQLEASHGKVAVSYNMNLPWMAVDLRSYSPVVDVVITEEDTICSVEYFSRKYWSKLSDLAGKQAPKVLEEVRSEIKRLQEEHMEKLPPGSIENSERIQDWSFLNKDTIASAGRRILPNLSVEFYSDDQGDHAGSSMPFGTFRHSLG